MAEQHKLRCSCGRYLRPRPEPDDWEAGERGYFHEFEECPCGGDVTKVASGPAPEHRPGGRKGTGKAKGKVRNYRFTCACNRPFKVRTGRRDLNATCNECGGTFEWEPSASEYTGDIKEAV